MSCTGVLAICGSRPSSEQVVRQNGSIWAKAPHIPLYDDGQYRVAAQCRYALYIQSRIVS
jgi:hypothetical protein